MAHQVLGEQACALGEAEQHGPLGPEPVVAQRVEHPRARLERLVEPRLVDLERFEEARRVPRVVRGAR
ncbi:hypothetical protein BA062_11805 [Prauserella flavalba]|uniref:Uncharacterized protein n=1 Tax=Prauserella flavalba TaxID=1477506 RepID=A0A318LUN7_9PSEU|nr:hypothetical protein [Prauserella flavalba]PXY36117.1 hypothetical protein BA062_11805 [Prauserella flavalba]